MDNDNREGELNRPYDIDDERKLVVRAKQELPYRTDAYSLLMKSYEKRIYWMCQRIICDDNESYDAAQEVLIRVFHHLPSFNEKSSFKTWLYSIARNTALTQLKKSKHLKQARELSEVSENDLKDSYSPHESIETAIDINKVFAKLNIEDREILSLRFVADLDIQEIADTLGLKLSATKMRLYRATEELRKLYPKESWNDCETAIFAV